MPDINIRTCTIDDYEILIRLWESVGLPYKPKGRDSKNKIKKELQKNCGFFLLAELDGKAVGTVLVTWDGRKGWINRLSVLPEYQNKGIARSLIEEAEKRLNDLGIGIIACLIEDRNKTSIEVFKHFGYVEFRGMHYLTKRKYPEV